MSPAMAQAPQRNGHTKGLCLNYKIFDVPLSAPHRAGKMLVVFFEPVLLFIVPFGDKAIINFKRCSHKSIPLQELPTKSVCRCYSPKSHPREWVDNSDPTYMRPRTEF